MNLLADKKNSALSKLKACADDTLYDTPNINVVFHMVGNIVGKGENAGIKHFLLFPKCLQKITATF